MNNFKLTTNINNNNDDDDDSSSSSSSSSCSSSSGTSSSHEKKSKKERIRIKEDSWGVDEEKGSSGDEDSSLPSSKDEAAATSAASRGAPALVDAVDVVESFEMMELHHDLLRGIFAYGFETPSAVQSRAIVPFAKGKDIIAQAQSGTGKTATFSISILQRIYTNSPEVG